MDVPGLPLLLNWLLSGTFPLLHYCEQYCKTSVHTSAFLPRHFCRIKFQEWHWWVPDQKYYKREWKLYITLLKNHPFTLSPIGCDRMYFSILGPK